VGHFKGEPPRTHAALRRLARSAQSGQSLLCAWQESLAQGCSPLTRVSIVTPTQANAAARSASRIATNTANMVVVLTAVAAYLRAWSARRKRSGGRAGKKVNRPLHRQLLLDPAASHARVLRMLQHNGPKAGRRAHLAHAAVMGVHAFCCGLPALAMLAAAVSGATSSVALLADSVTEIHHFLHAHEVWILLVSAALVVTGGCLELAARRSRQHGFPWLFAFSVLCFLANVTIIVAHRGT
jgi:hypothetical protein